MKTISSNRQLAHLGRVLTASLIFMLLGTFIELFLLEHYEDWEQLIPVVLIGTSFVLLLSLLVTSSSILQRLFKLILALTALSGIYGSFLHLKANIEFEMEMKPSATVMDVFFDSFFGAFPVLAPGSMIVLALLGYSYLLLINQKQ